MENVKRQLFLFSVRVVYYDNYDFLSASIFSGAISNYRLVDTNKESTPVASLNTGQVVFATNGEPLYRVMYYDAKGRLIDARSTYPSQLYAQTVSTYTFTDKLSSVVTSYKYRGNALPFNKITHDYTYDQNSDLLKKEYLFFNNNITERFTTAYTYNNLGQIESKNLNSILTNNYIYDIHGWLKNTVYFNQKNRTKYVPFAETLYYADGAGTPCYNGNISSLQYQSADTTLLKMLSYTYDGMNRLTASSFCASGMYGRYTEYFTYNKDSAITGLVRWGKRFNGYNIIDNLKCSYTGNQLKAISDGVPGYYTSYTGASDYKDNTVQNQEYYYDGCGSMTQDRNKGISLINYDYNDMPTRIQFRNGNVTEYIYAADGTKLRTIHRLSRSNLNVPYGAARTLAESETLSVDSTSYIGSLEIDRNFGGKYYFDDGYISLTNTASGTYHVFAKDHLGNVRAVVDSNGKIEQVYNYYAFGGLLNDVTNTAYAQTHKYNGKELDRVSGLELYDYGARNYDAAIGQFTTMDPLCEKYYGISPYAYCGGNPINAIDPDGRAINFVAAGIGALGGAIIYGGIAYFEGKSTREIVGAAAEGAITGGVAGLTLGASTAITVVGVAEEAAISAASSAAGNVVNQSISKGKVNSSELMQSTVTGGIAGAIGSVSGKLINKVGATQVKGIEAQRDAIVSNSKKLAITEVKRSGAKMGGKYAKQQVKRLAGSIRRNAKSTAETSISFTKKTTAATNWSTQTTIGVTAGKVSESVKKTDKSNFLNIFN